MAGDGSEGGIIIGKMNSNSKMILYCFCTVGGQWKKIEEVKDDFSGQHFPVILISTG